MLALKTAILNIADGIPSVSKFYHISAYLSKNGIN